MAIVEWEHDNGIDTHWIEEGRLAPDSNGCYAIGIYRWPWTLATSRLRRSNTLNGNDAKLSSRSGHPSRQKVLSYGDDD
ncbi:hypothetical protein [Verrucosispora sp. FIM060022]|uniref:hypothetical protein n=1 Tax=Verrucosispora sp. FIM060022 TaxID=1479020 RepID=UPI000F8962DD|nr:hypothetical protein [Verrucosispora sp. FIM060022]RUL89889.1 hypothetical protein EG812_28650 [Verrucosispora sp. FIM060022]